MKRFILSVLVTFLLVSLATSSSSFAQVKLNIGDPAPEIKVSKWIKGTPVTKLEKEKIYVVEFWATWCGPCIVSMPHLSEFAEKHKKEATVIGVNIWEGAHGDSNKTYDSFLPKVTRFVEQMGSKMSYEVAMDNNEEFMANNWMKAAGQSGIPCSFIVKNGTIQWIGHPINLDSVFTKVTGSDYDVVAARKAADERTKKSSALTEKYTVIYGSYTEAMNAKDYNKAIHILDSATVSMPEYVGVWGFFKAQTLIEHFNEDTAITFIKKWQSGKPGFTASIAVVICRKAGLSKDTYLYAIDLIKNLMEGPNVIPSMMYNEIATGYANMKDFKNAVETQSKAVDSAKQSLKEGKFIGFVLEDTVKEYEKKVEEYKTKL